MSDQAQSLKDVETRANAGDVMAQLALGQALVQMGRPHDARPWFDKAVATGHPIAKFALARLLLEEAGASRNFPEVLTLLHSAADQNENLSKCALAVMLASGAGCEPDWTTASKLLLSAVAAGDRMAIRQLGMLLSIAGEHPATGGLLYDAAKRGDGLASFAVLRRHARGRPVATQAECTKWFEALKERRHPLIDKVANFGGAPADVSPAAPWDAASIAILPMRPLPPPVQLCRSPSAWTFERLLTEEECDYIVGLAGPRLAPALVINPMTGNSMPSMERTSTNAILRSFQQDLVLHCIERRLAAAAGLPFENGEMTSVLHYRPGEEYRPHFDFLNESAQGAAGYHVSGQRVTTLLVCLNDEFEGGETRFLTPNVGWKGRTGDALLFHNVTADGKPDMNSRHAGVPVTSGEKWLLSKWYRAAKFLL